MRDRPLRLLWLNFLACMMVVLFTGLAQSQWSDAFVDVRRRLDRGKSHALLVGVSQYERQPQLPWIDEEMRRLQKTLQDAGFTIHTPHTLAVAKGPEGTLTRAELDAAVKAFAKKVGDDPENRLIVYFATHGFATSRSDLNGGGYLITSEITSSPEKEAYSVKDLTSALSGIQSKHLFVFVNSCFGAAMAPVLNMRSAEALEKPGGGPDPLSDYVRGKLEARAWLFLSAGTDMQTVPDDKSPFALAVSKGIDGEADLDGDGYIMGMELATFVRKTVAQETAKKGGRNDPIFAWLTGQGDAGDFVFQSRLGPREVKSAVLSIEDEITRARNERLLERRSFTECPECPVMIEFDGPGKRIGLARTEITYLEWDACYRELGCARYIDDGGLGRGNRAVGGITWLDAQQYLLWLNGKRASEPPKAGEAASKCERYRLPMKPEWKAAATDRQNIRFTWGDEPLQDRASCWGCGEGQDGREPMEVASFGSNVGGFFDMTGNLWEWVEEPANLCEFTKLSLPGGQCAPGTVMGGSFATRFAQLNTLQEATVPRTRSPGEIGAADVYSLPTVGLRVACVLKTP
jgi:hypothetical protein